jgi:pimeloyl-ACP methyl ester carboxylesterase
MQESAYMKTKKIQLAKWDAAYWESEGPERTIVFIHPNSSSKSIFEKQFNSALAGRYRLIAPDLPGHGESSRISDGAGDYSVTSFTEFLVDLCRRLDCEEAVFVGSSLG